jgi:AcrR family transcriptional regulator
MNSQLQSGKRAGHQRRKEARPAEIRCAAFEVFAERGFAGATIDAIAQRAGMASGSIYRYYINKEELLKAVLDSVAIAGVGDQPTTKDLSTHADLTERVVTAVRSLRQSRALTIGRVLLVESNNYPELVRIWHSKFLEPIIQSVVDFTRHAQARAEFRSGDPKLQAMSIIAPVILTALFDDAFGSDPDILTHVASFVEQHVRTVLHGLHTGTAETTVSDVKYHQHQ